MPAPTFTLRQRVRIVRETIHVPGAGGRRQWYSVPDFARNKPGNIYAVPPSAGRDGWGEWYPYKVWIDAVNTWVWAVPDQIEPLWEVKAGASSDPRYRIIGPSGDSTTMHVHDPLTDCPDAVVKQVYPSIFRANVAGSEYTLLRLD